MMQLRRLPVRTPVENAHLRQQKTEKRNGVIVCSLSLEVDTVSRCQPQATRRKDCPKSQCLWESQRIRYRGHSHVEGRRPRKRAESVFSVLQSGSLASGFRLSNTPTGVLP